METNGQAQNSILPPLPASDAKSLQWNRKDNFYGVGSREFWGENEIIRIEDKPMEKCNHYFEPRKADFVCKKCNFGLVSGLGLICQDGKLLYKNEPINF